MKAQISIVAVEFSGDDTTTAENVSTVPNTNNPFGPVSIDSPLESGSGVTGEMGVKWRKSLEIALENKASLNGGWMSSTPVQRYRGRGRSVKGESLRVTIAQLAAVRTLTKFTQSMDLFFIEDRS